MKNLLIAAMITLLSAGFPALAQKSGQSATITLGIVEQMQQVTLQSTGGGKGALVGGTLGYASGSGKSKSKKRRNAIIGGAAGTALSRSGTAPGMEYTVKVNDGSAIVVVSDQTQIQIGDCVSVEQSGDRANIRRQDPAACRPSSAHIIAEIEEELIEDASDCDLAKKQLLAATTAEELELASAKARILCN